MDDNALQLQKLLAQAKAEFTEQRLLVKQWLANLVSNVSNLDEKLLSDNGIIIDKEKFTPEKSVPSLFAEHFNADAYKTEIGAVTELVNKLNRLADKTNKEALRLLTERNNAG